MWVDDGCLFPDDARPALYLTLSLLYYESLVFPSSLSVHVPVWYLEVDVSQQLGGIRPW